MKHAIPELDARGLRGFAIKMAIVIAAIFGGFLPWVFDFDWPLWPWVVAGVLVLWGLVAPTTMGGFYRGWMRVGLAIGVFNSKIILSIVFYLIIMPAGFIMRALGRDPMMRKLDSNAETYRVKSRSNSRQHLENPY